MLVSSASCLHHLLPIRRPGLLTVLLTVDCYFFISRLRSYETYWILPIRTERYCSYNPVALCPESLPEKSLINSNNLLWSTVLSFIVVCLFVFTRCSHVQWHELQLCDKIASLFCVFVPAVYSLVR